VPFSILDNFHKNVSLVNNIRELIIVKQLQPPENLGCFLVDSLTNKNLKNALK
jgi:hypothetical protein